MLRIESPPSSKKLSWSPTRSHPQDLAQIAASGCLDRGARRDVGPAPRPRSDGRGQRVAVDLAVGRQRQGRERTKAAGTMYSGSMLARKRAQLVAAGADARSAGTT